MPQPSTNRTLSGCGFHHLALRVHDFDRSLVFYTEGLGFRVAHSWGEGDARATLLDMGDGNYLELFASKPGQIPDKDATNTGWPFLHLALRSDDVDRDIERVRALGAEVTIEPTNPDVLGIPVRIAFFVGPDGEVLEFFDHQAPEGTDRL